MELSFFLELYSLKLDRNLGGSGHNNKRERKLVSLCETTPNNNRIEREDFFQLLGVINCTLQAVCMCWDANAKIYAFAHERCIFHSKGLHLIYGKHGIFKVIGPDVWK